jgi:ribosomal protein L37E
MNKPINVDPSTFRCDRCGTPYTRTSETTLHIIWTCQCGKSAYHWRKEMPSTITPETIAELFHTTYERLAPAFGYETRRESAVSWQQVPEANKRLMIAVAGEVLRYLEVAGEESADGGQSR